MSSLARDLATDLREQGPFLPRHLAHLQPTQPLAPLMHPFSPLTPSPRCNLLADILCRFGGAGS